MDTRRWKKLNTSPSSDPSAQTSNTGPVPTISSDLTGPTAISPINFKIAFNEVVSGFEVTDVEITNGMALTLIGGETEYTFSVTPLADGLVSIRVPEGTVIDIAQIPNVTSEIFSIQYDGSSPSSPTNLSDGGASSQTETFNVTWTASIDNETDIKSYEIKVGLTAGGDEITQATDIGKVTSYEATCSSGDTCYVSIRAKNGAGAYSDWISTDGMTISGVALDAIANQSLNENQAITPVNPGDGGDDFDQYSNAITYSCFYDTNANGSVASTNACTTLPGVSFNTTSGLVTWTPDYSQSGVYEFKIIGSSGLTSDHKVFTITVDNVNRDPVLDALGDQTVNENVAITQVNAGDAGDDYDVDGDSLTYTCFYDLVINSSVANDTACTSLSGVSFNSSSGVFNWTPNYSQSGTYEFKIIGTDPGASSDFELFSVTVSNVNRAPSLDAISGQTVDENSAITEINAGDGGDDYDSDGDGITYSCYYDSTVNGAVAETVACTSLSGVTFEAGTGKMNWTPSYLQSGSYEFKIKGVDAGTLSSTVIFDITVNNVNRPPVINAIADQTVNENVAITQINATDGADDYDIDGDAITYSCFYDTSGNGAVAETAACTSLSGVSFTAGTGVMTWTPSYSQSGTYEFMIKGTDPGSQAGTEIFVITVNNVNRTPSLDAIGDQSVAETVAITEVDAGDGGDDTDTDGDTLTYSCFYDTSANGAVAETLSCTSLTGLSFSTGTGVMNWTPSTAGTYEFLIKAVDVGTLSDTEVFVITVTAGAPNSCGSLAQVNCYDNTRDPIPVCSCRDLDSMRYNLNASYQLQNDITCYGYNSGFGDFAPIPNFSGSLYGRGYSICDLTINRPNSVNVGFFKGIYAVNGNNPVVRDITFLKPTINASQRVGTIAGLSDNASVRNVAIKNLDLYTKNGGAGGIIEAPNGYMKCSYVTGSIVVSSTPDAHPVILGYVSVGGLTGGGNTSNSIEDSYARVNITSLNHGKIGGVSGSMNYGSTSKTYATGLLNVNPALSSSGHTAHHYGLAFSCGNNFWDTEATNNSNPSFNSWNTTGGTCAVGKTTLEMKNQATYTGWDFSRIWDISPTQNDGYPTLRCPSCVLTASSTTVNSGDNVTFNLTMYPTIVAGNQQASFQYYDGSGWSEIAQFTKTGNDFNPITIPVTQSRSFKVVMNFTDPVDATLNAECLTHVKVNDGSTPPTVEEYVGGSFTGSRNYGAKLSGGTWTDFGIPNGTVRAIAISGSNIYIGGDFTTVDSPPVTVNHIAMWNGTSWSALDGGVNGVVRSISVSGANVYVGGDFTTAGSSALTVNRIAKWNGSAWSALGTGMDDTVAAVAGSGATVFAGGSFTTAGGVTAYRVAKWNGGSWSALTDMYGDYNGVNDTVHAIAIINASPFNVIIGGQFTQLVPLNGGTSAANGLVRWSEDCMSGNCNLITENELKVAGTVRAFAVDGSVVYVGGLFAEVGHYNNGENAISANNVAALYFDSNGSSSFWQALDRGVDGTVYSLAVSSRKELYASGAFANAGSSAAARVAKWSIPAFWQPVGLGLNNDVLALGLK